MYKKSIVITVMALLTIMVMAVPVAADTTNYSNLSRTELEQLDYDALMALYMPFRNIILELNERYGIDFIPVYADCERGRQDILEILTTYTPATFFEFLMEIVPMLRGINSYNSLVQEISLQHDNGDIDNYTAEVLLRNLNRIASSGESSASESIARAEMLYAGYDIYQILGSIDVVVPFNSYTADVWQASWNHLGSGLNVGIFVNLTRWSGGGRYNHLIFTRAQIGGPRWRDFYGETVNRITFNQDRNRVYVDVRGRIRHNAQSSSMTLQPAFGVWYFTYSTFS